MRRYLRYWAIRLLGREFMALSGRAKLAGLWWCLSQILMCSWADTNPGWSAWLVIANFVGSCFAVTATFKQARK